jgi:UDP-glucuronate 4-epimerase
MLITGHKGFVGLYATEAFPDSVGYDILDGENLTDVHTLRTLFIHNTIDTVIHLAARAGVRASTLYPTEFVDTNINGTHALLSLAEEFGVKHFIHFSSSSVYGNQKPPNAESAHMTPTSIYGMTKAASEMLCRISPVPTTVIRPFTLYGKNGRKDQVVYTWLNCYAEGKPAPFYGDGTTKRGYTHVLDVIDGLSLILKAGAPQSGHEVYNIGGSEVISLKTLREIYTEELPDITFEELPRPSADAFENWADITKAEHELGWKPTRSFDTEIRAIIRDFALNVKG